MGGARSADGCARSPASLIRLWNASTPFCGRAGPSNTIGCGKGVGRDRTADVVEDDGFEAAGDVAAVYLLRINSPDWASFVGASNISNMGGSVISWISSAKAAEESAVEWLIEEECTRLSEWTPLRQAAESGCAFFTGRVAMAVRVRMQDRGDGFWTALFHRNIFAVGESVRQGGGAVHSGFYTPHEVLVHLERELKNGVDVHERCSPIYYTEIGRELNL